ncbi:MAG: gluconate 2-dehydrogenase subunit 3 family protein [Chitinophagaceae bacterium]
MKRRNAIRNIVIASGGLITLPTWISSCGLGDSTTHQTSFSLSEQQLLAAVTDTIIPAGNAIGAVSVGVDKFLQKLIDDCHPKEVQDNVMKQLNALEASAQKINGKYFGSCTQVQRQELLLKLSASAVKDEKGFFDLLKSETIRGFNTSKEVMQQYLGYRVAPGHFNGSVDVKA